MKTTGCCGTNSTAGADKGYETVHIAKAQNNCRLCDDYAESQKAKPVAVICCEGACLRGEIARQAANILCHTSLRKRPSGFALAGHSPRIRGNGTWFARLRV